MNSRISRNTKKQIFLLVSGGHICAPQRDTKMASPYKALQIWVKRFSKYLPYKISHRPDSWRSLWHIYLLLIYFLDSGLGEGGGLPYERDGDARRLAQGCKFWSLVSLRVFLAKQNILSCQGLVWGSAKKHRITRRETEVKFSFQLCLLCLYIIKTHCMSYLCVFKQSL